MKATVDVDVPMEAAQSFLSPVLVVLGVSFVSGVVSLLVVSTEGVEPAEGAGLGGFSLPPPQAAVASRAQSPIR